MAEQPSINTSNFIHDFERTLAALDTALNDAIRAVSSMRAFLPQISALAQAVTTIESAVTQARQNIDVAPASPAQASAIASSPQAALRAIEPTAETAPTIETREGQQHVTTSTQCLRLSVTKRDGSLDLKTVDNAVNEHPEIVDLALLDYDGRQATLKVWVSGSIDRQALQQSLTEDLLRRVGESAEVQIEFDQESAAA